MFIWAGGRRENVLFRHPSTCALTPAEAAGFTEVWFADLCPPSLENPAGGRPYRVFDHHASNERKFGHVLGYTFDLTKSGTSLMATVLGILDEEHETTEDLVAALEAYDLGRFEHAAGMRLADLASTFSQEELLDEIFLQRDPEEILWDRDLTCRADAVASARDIYASSAAKAAVVSFVYYAPEAREIPCAIVTSPVYWKNAVAVACLERTYRFGGRDSHVEAVAIIDPVSQMCSLRSLDGGPDVSRIAVEYGGGGHARAAGFRIGGSGLFDVMAQKVFG